MAADSCVSADHSRRAGSTEPARHQLLIHSANLAGELVFQVSDLFLDIGEGLLALTLEFVGLALGAGLLVAGEIPYGLFAPTLDLVDGALDSVAVLIDAVTYELSCR